MIYIFFISAILIPFYLLGWPTQAGPFQYDARYFLILAALLLVCFQSFRSLSKSKTKRLKEALSKKVSLVIFGLLAGLLAAELVLRLTGLAEWGGGQGPYQPNAGFKYKDLYSYNSLGFRGPQLPAAKDKRVLRIIGLGDSFTFGQGLKWDETYLEQLRAMIEGKGAYYCETGNFGKSGWNTVQEYGALKDTVLPYSPDIVVLLFVLNDFLLTDYYLLPFTYSGDNSASLYGYEMKYLWRSHLFFSLVKAYNNIKRPFSEEIKATFASDSNNTKYCLWHLKEIAALCRGKGVTPVLLISPLFDDLKRYPFDELRARLGNWGREFGFVVVDTLPEFKKGTKTGKEFRLSRGDNHPNARANKIFAESLYSGLSHFLA